MERPISGYQETLDQKFYMIKKKLFQQQCNQKTDAKEKYLISKQLEHRCTKMRIGIQKNAPNSGQCPKNSIT